MQVANMRPEKNRESFSTSACGNDRHVRSNRWTVLVPPVSVVLEMREHFTMIILQPVSCRTTTGWPSDMSGLQTSSISAQCGCLFVKEAVSWFQRVPS